MMMRLSGLLRRGRCLCAIGTPFFLTAGCDDNSGFTPQGPLAATVGAAPVYPGQMLGNGTVGKRSPKDRRNSIANLFELHVRQGRS